MYEYISQILDALGLLFMMGLAYSFGGLNSKVNQASDMINKTYMEVTQLNLHIAEVEDRVQKTEDTKLDKEDFHKLEKRFIELETKHTVIHKEN